MGQDTNPFGRYRESQGEETKDLRLWCDLYDRYTRGDDTSLDNRKVAATVAAIALVLLSPHDTSLLGEDGMLNVFREGFTNRSGKPLTPSLENLYEMYRMRNANGRHPFAAPLIGGALADLCNARREELEEQLNSRFHIQQQVFDPSVDLHSEPSLRGQITVKNSGSTSVEDAKAAQTQNASPESSPMLVIDLQVGSVSYGQKTVRTGSKYALQILSILADNPDIDFSAKDLISRIWGSGVSENSVSHHKARAEQLLDEVGSDRRIVTRRGYGWSLPMEG